MPVELRVPGTAELLDAWELGRANERARPQLLVAAVGQASSDTESGELTLGARNRLLLRARAMLFGADCEAVAACPTCGVDLEAALPVLALISNQADADRARTLRVGELELTYRLPTAADLVGLPAQLDQAGRELLGRCVLSAVRAGEQVPWTELTDTAIGELDRVVAGADPDALIEVELICPGCDRAQLLHLDPVDFLWTELDRWAWRVLAEVHQLAAAYGWSEAAILALSPTRRQTYLQLAGVA